MPRPERPLGPEDNALLAFAADLRRLREKAGKPTYRDLSKQAHYSVTVLSEAAAGRKLPTLAVTLAYVKACEGDVEEWRARWHELSTELATPQDDGRRPPYLGLAAFQVDDQDLFFGRDALVAELQQKAAERRFLGVFGASGSGKSSLLRAGLVARHKGPVVVCTPGQFTPPGPDELLVVDQFEEIFTLCPDEAERAEFIDTLLDLPNRVVIGVRADFYGHCGRYPRLVEALKDSQVLVGPMSADELRQAIVQPAAKEGCVIDGALVARLVAEAAALPLVSHALLETWHRRRGLRLTVDGYEEAGGIQHAITRTGEEVYTSLDPAGQAAAKRILLRLTALGEGTADTKRRVARDSFDDTDVVVLERLAAARLVSIDEKTVEITHEALISSWPRLKDWLNDDRAGLRLHRQLSEATEAWAAVGHDDGALYRGIRLTTAKDWAAANPDALTPKETRFLNASLEADEAERTSARKRTRRLRQLVAALTVFVLLTTIAGAVAVAQWRQAVADRDRATSRQAGEHAAGLLESDPALAGQIGVAAYRIADTPEARGAVLSTFAAPYPTRLHGDGEQLDAIAISPDGRMVATGAGNGVAELWRDRRKVTRFPDVRRVIDVAFSRDGRLLAIAGSEGVRLYDVTADPQPVTTIMAGTKVNGVAFNADGSVLATAAETVQTWNVRTGQATAEVPGHDEEVYSVAYSPSGLLATAGSDGRILLWDGQSAREILHAKGPISGIAFSRNGTLAATDETHTTWLYTKDGISPFPGPDTLVRGLAFDHETSRLVLGGNDGVVRVMDIATRQEVSRLTQPNRVRDLAFNGTTLATSSSGGRAYLWHDPLSNPSGHATELEGVSAHTATNTIATRALLDPTVRLWRTDWKTLTPLATLTGHTGPVLAAAFSRDGTKIATSSRDRTVRVWDVHHPEQPIAVLDGYRESISTLAWSPDGTVLASGDDFGDLVLWDIPSRRRLATLTDNVRNVNAVAFSPDGKRVATGNTDRTVRLWDLSDRENPKQAAKLTGFRESVTSVAFSADGKLLSGGGLDRTARIWNAADTALLATITDQNGPIRTVRFTPDATELITTSGDRSAKLWDVRDPRAPKQTAVLRSPGATVPTVFFKDSRKIGVVTTEHTVRFVDIDLEAAAKRVCELAGTPITAEEWQAQFGDRPYHFC